MLLAWQKLVTNTENFLFKRVSYTTYSIKLNEKFIQTVANLVIGNQFGHL